MFLTKYLYLRNMQDDMKTAFFFVLILSGSGNSWSLHHINPMGVSFTQACCKKGIILPRNMSKIMIRRR